MNILADTPSLPSLLESVGQQHVLRWWNELDAEQQASLAAQIESIDWLLLQELVQGSDASVDWSALAARAMPPAALTLDAQREPEFRRSALAAGSGAIRAGEVAFVLTAGGQGSRLGFDHPKGCYPIGPVSGRSLFQIMLDHARARGRQHGVSIPVCIMTSPPTDAAIRRFLRQNDWFGYPPSDVHVFCQGIMPAVDARTGEVLMSSRHEIFVSPDGHGGALQALRRAGLLDRLQERGVRHVFYGQIDNPLLQVCDPLLIGCHIRQAAEITTQAVRKRDAMQKVGNVVAVDGVTQIIEYSDLPEQYARQVNPDGSLKLWAGSIAVHVFSLDFLQRAAHAGASLPFHRAIKKVPHIDSSGSPVDPAGNNAIKFERFIFDLLPLSRKTVVYEVDPADGFAPLKNAPPAETESPAWVQRAISSRFRRWLERAGCRVAPGVPVEIHPCFAVEEEELVGRLEPGQYFDQPLWLE